MANYFLCFGIFRILLPCILAISIIFRPSVLSGIYLLFLCYFPFVPVPTTSTMAGHTGIYLKLMIVVSILTSLTQAAFQIFLVSDSPYGHMLVNCDFLERILRTVGLVKMDHLPVIEIVNWAYPEPLMFLTSIATFWSCKKLVQEHPDDLESVRTIPTKNVKNKYLSLLTSIGRYGVLVTMCIAAIIVPSVFGALYFLVFLSSATWWACYKKLERKFAVMIRCLMVIVFAHMLVLYAYQTQWPQELLPPNEVIPRILGLVPIFSYTCNDPREITWVQHLWDTYAYPLALYLFYAISIYETKLLMKPQIQKKQGTFSRLESNFSGSGFGRQLSQRRSERRLMRSNTTIHRWQSATRKVRLMKGMSPSRRYGSGSQKPSLIQDSMGSVTVHTDATEDIPMDQLDVTEEEYKPTICEKIMYFLEALLQVIIRSSYIGTNIIMMTWSITYLSWLTFVLLLWANLLWLIPNQRKAMLRSSPFLVLYAWFLLISAYVFCMNLTDAELPSEVQGINLAQIGFVKINVLPFDSLAVKCLFTGMFWITLRQYMQERIAERQNSALADMVAPLQVSVGAAAGVEKQAETSTLDKFGQWMKTFLASIWIWIVAITLFFVAITGQRMTGFRIVYMALFLIFVITFQLSFKIWKKLMLGFWLTVIIYSMLMLIMVYTYQFDHFPEYWESLGVPFEQQADIGLERYETKQLFVRLVTPTFFVIITVIQVHYFHKDFMKIYEDSFDETRSTRSNNEIKDDESERPREEGGTSVKFNVSDLNTYPIESNKRTKIINGVRYYWNLLFLFLEIHMVKLVLLVGILACIVQPCALDLAVIILLVIGTVVGKRVQPIAIYTCSVFFSILLLARMVYQIKYFKATHWEVTCSEGNDTNETVNDAEWLGFTKVGNGKSLMYFIRYDIIYIIVTTLWTTVKIRQLNLRRRMGIPHAKVEVMFPSITRADADKNLSNFCKYMMNYGFYKFGLEVCLIMTVALIGFRMDLYALLYALWLCGLFTLKRETLSNIWNVYISFIAILIPFQYCMVVGLPPSLCIVFPWDTSSVLQKFQEWAFLMDSVNPLPAKKLICDYLLLLLVCRQAIGFKKEDQQRTMGLVFPGGSNEVIIQHSEEDNFENPVPDFITYCRSYLDVFKRAVLLSLLWITLAVLFLAGTNRVNIFSIGYLIGAFVFLWQGTDLYLWPIPKILKRWNYLLAYNVSVITIKAGLQILGCLFMEELTDNVCWPVQLFAIGCVNKFQAHSVLVSDDLDPKCTVPREYIGLVWDGLSFAFLILQRRVFHSYNFFHMIDEAKASTILASRGAELIEELRMKRMQEQEDNERNVLEKIKSKMDRIKASQQKVHGASYKDATTHFQEQSGERPIRRRRIPDTYKAAVRSGDYYMFDDLHVEDLDPLEALPKTTLSDTVVDEEEPDDGRYTVGEFLSTAMKSDIGQTVRRASLNAELRRQRSTSLKSRLSEPASRVDDQGKSVKIQEDPIPSTSQDGMSELMEPDTEAKTTEDKRSLWVKIKDFFIFLYYFLDSIMMSCTKFLNSYTKDYRYVIRVLRREKKNLKETTNYSVGRRVGSSQVWEPTGSFHELIAVQRSTSLPHLDRKQTSSSDSDTKALASDIPQSSELGRRKTSVLTVPEIRILAPSLERGLDSPSLKSKSISLFKIMEEEEAEMSSYDQPSILRLLLAIWYILTSKSELMCYLTIFLNQIKSATFLSLPLPLMVFLWGTMTIPRPTKTFWVTIIAYTEVIVLIKCMFQFDIIPWNRKADVVSDPLYPPRIIGIERKSNYALWDLLLLLVVFFHRFMLKSMGLWQSTISGTQKTEDGFYRMDDDGNLILIEDKHHRPKALRLKELEKEPPPPLPEPEEKDPETGSHHEPPHKKKTRLNKLFRSLQLTHFISPSVMFGLNRSGEEEETIIDDGSAPASIRRHEADDELPEGDLNSLVKITSSRVDAEDKFPESLKLALMKYTETFKLFFSQLIQPTSRVSADVYSYMFLCDFFNFFVLLLGYTSFGTNQGEGGGVTTYLEDNKIPVLFLLMLIIQFMLIIIDRGIYLRKNLIAKIMFQYFLIIFLHIWLFVLYPTITERSFNSVLPPQLYYIVKCFYLLLSAYQIRCGYPTRILGNFLCKGYNYVNMFLFKAFLAVPFLFELRTVMDWMWTDTSMTVFDWIKMEDIFAHIFQLKCQRYVEAEYPQPRGEKKKSFVKYFMGGAILLIIIGIIWFPLVFFSLGNAVGKPNIPFDVTLDLRIGPYDPVFQMSAQDNNIFQLNKKQYDEMLDVYGSNKPALTFITNYEAYDVAAIKLSTDSANVWTISPPDRLRMIAEVNSNYSITVRMNYKVSHRTSKSEDSGILSNFVQVSIPPFLANGDRNPAREHLSEMLTTEKNTSLPVLLTEILPKFLKVTNNGVVKPVGNLMEHIGEEDNANLFRNATLILHHAITEGPQGDWWKFSEDCNDINSRRYLSKLPFSDDCKNIVLYTFNDKIFPASLSIITGGGIIGLYTTFVLLIFHYIRGVFMGQCFKIMYEDLPYIDRILQLLYDIYLVRESNEFVLEEDLFAKLIFLFRSPETLIKWTRPVEEGNPEDEENE
ncbi:piezo-type mechanosensitive ion channel component isoform X4 [Harmonia axyridis]|uniref:piezo-type mechanosensitive ion channel component isoform X4 n=1 Tax=Harmonia axyridis TaxID=115357 RepID=UPI001E2771C5|nr:piezo-type mechanosensitive ion channel component isoform X4 [Harmonia axyridis]